MSGFNLLSFSSNPQEPLQEKIQSLLCKTFQMLSIRVTLHFGVETEAIQNWQFLHSNQLSLRIPESKFCILQGLQVESSR